MNSAPLYNVLDHFDFDLLNHPDFKEDSVREEIIVPIIKNLGYSASKPFQIIRSRNLTHPFVSIGSQRKKIYITPDYLFEVNSKPAWILDAKSPSESTINSKAVEQGYSYAMHSEVQVKYFALCNGVYFTLYNVSKPEPVLHFPTRSIPGYWSQLKEFLSPEKIFNNTEVVLKKDFGLHLKRLGFDQFKSLLFHKVPIFHIGQLDPNMFSMSAGIEIENQIYIATFDFGQKQFEQLKSKLPLEAIEKLATRDPKSRQLIQFADRVYFVNVNAKVSNQLQETDQEIFLPLQVNEFI